MNGALLQQVFVVEFVVHNQMCDGCHRVEAKDFWRACVQIRQKVGSQHVFSLAHWTLLWNLLLNLAFMLVGSLGFVQFCMFDFGSMFRIQAWG